MLFNSVEFFLFLPVVAFFYFITPVRWRWLILLLASYGFYMYWRADYAILIAISTTVDYLIALKMGAIAEKGKRKKWLWISLLVNLGLLSCFKYLNFFSDSINLLLHVIGLSPRLPESNLLLPIGISFYTFQTLSYSIDVYRGRIQPETHFGKFALFVSFFPQLVAGPIERAKSLLPQFSFQFQYDHERIKNGCLLILAGLFKKVVIADRLAEYIQFVYANPAQQSGGDALIATYFFAIQVYCDFSGYSDIAVGAAQILGIKLSENFKRPFHGQSLQEVWSRWHVTLIAWFRDYLFIPLARQQPKRVFINIMVVYLATGLWHGAHAKFLIWGGINGLIIYVARRLKKEKLGLNIKWAWLNRFIAFNLFCLSVPFFCAQTTNDAITILHHIFTDFHFSNLAFRINASYYEMCLAIGALAALEWVHHYQENHGSVRTWLAKQVPWFRWTFYYLLIFSILLFGWFNAKEFVYFQF
ncbi:MAG: MBOAT family O-acyltransferase [Flammeovirgaceae bacterium]